ncbi:tetratricopeptide repeat protein [candidate division WOR-3 bacterium]|nr:tetratricopeptide repeat protein [candidate division WOR-3 bacterium]
MTDEPSRRPTGLLVAAVAAAAVLLGSVGVATWFVGRRAASLHPAIEDDAPLIVLADSIFAAERNLGAEIDLEPVLSAAVLRRLRIQSLPAHLLLAPFISAGRIAASLAELSEPYASAPILRGLAGLELESGRPAAAARHAALAGYRYLCVALPRDEVATRLLRLAYGLHRTAGENTAAVLCLEHLAASGTNQMEYGSADSLLRNALAVYQRLGDPEAVGRVLVNLGCNQHRAGRYQGAMDCYLEALDHVRANGLDDRPAMGSIDELLETVGENGFVRLCTPRLSEPAARELIGELLQVREEPVQGG